MTTFPSLPPCLHLCQRNLPRLEQGDKTIYQRHGILGAVLWHIVHMPNRLFNCATVLVSAADVTECGRYSSVSHRLARTTFSQTLVLVDQTCRLSTELIAEWACVASTSICTFMSSFPKQREMNTNSTVAYSKMKLRTSVQFTSQGMSVESKHVQGKSMFNLQDVVELLPFIMYLILIIIVKV